MHANLPNKIRNMSLRPESWPDPSPPEQRRDCMQAHARSISHGSAELSQSRITSLLSDQKAGSSRHAIHGGDHHAPHWKENGSIRLTLSKYRRRSFPYQLPQSSAPCISAHGCQLSLNPPHICTVHTCIEFSSPSLIRCGYWMFVYKDT